MLAAALENPSLLEGAVSETVVGAVIAIGAVTVSTALGSYLNRSLWGDRPGDRYATKE